MRLNRIYTPGPLLERSEVALTNSGANHVARVLRLVAGDIVGVFDGEGREFRATIANIKGARVTVRVDEAVTALRESSLDISLLQGISRGERMDLVVQKATELGVSAIVPIITSRSVVKLDRQQATKKQEHWRNIAIAACEQCGRACVPRIDSPTTLDKVIGERKSTLRLMLDPTATQSLSSLHIDTAKIELLVGPEGGLADEETALAQKTNFTAVKLGPRILRTETAAIAALAVIQAKWGDLGGDW